MSNVIAANNEQPQRRRGGRLGDALRVLRGKAQVAVPEAPAPQPREVQTVVEYVPIGPGETKHLGMHNRAVRVAIPEHVGQERHGNNVVATFSVPGKDNKPLSFTIIRRQDGRDVVHGAEGFPIEWANEIRRPNVPRLSVLPTDQLPLLDELNRHDITETEFAAVRSHLAWTTVKMGSSIHVGRSRAFGDLLGSQASSDHLTIGLTARESDTHQDAKVEITDHSTNGTDVTAGSL